MDKYYKVLSDAGIEARDMQMLPASWHGDIHFKAKINDTPYSVRFIKDDREFNCIPSIIMNNNVLRSQITYGRYLRENDIPFMKSFDFGNNNFILYACIENKNYRVVIFEWLQGVCIKSSNEIIAYEIGRLARQMHDASEQYSCDNLVEIHSFREYTLRLNQLKEMINENHINNNNLDLFIACTEKNIETAFKINRKKIVAHGDLNFPNLFWNMEFNKITGIVDFDSIGITTRISDLAWIMKWYSRERGIGNEVFSVDLVQRVVDGYGYREIFNMEDSRYLISFVWLHSCMNNGFIMNMENAIKQKKVNDTLNKYLSRGKDFEMMCRAVKYD